MYKILIFIISLLSFITVADEIKVIKSIKGKEVNSRSAGYSEIYQKDDLSIFVKSDKNNKEYSRFLVWLGEKNREKYIENILQFSELEYRDDSFIIIKTNKINKLEPHIHGGIVNIDSEVRKTTSVNQLENINIKFDTEIAEILAKLNSDSISTNVLYLENYGTRNCFKNEAVSAQNWIADKFRSFNLEVEVMDFELTYGTDESSDNVIAVLPGKTIPNEYVIIGGHYDSISRDNLAPGADDNASGTCGVIEAARILSNYEFDRTIVFCAWSGEEYGLYGSQAYAERAAEQNMKILGYVNLDMIGYLSSKNMEMVTDVIAPSSAEELYQYYKNIASVYVPNLEVRRGVLTGGDSDHTSFNRNGYWGIFPFEDLKNGNPYIHTNNDRIGPSVNNFDYALTLTKAAVATIVSLANSISHPENISLISKPTQNEIYFSSVFNATHYKIFRNDNADPIITTVDTVFIDENISSDLEYSYTVQAVNKTDNKESVVSKELKTINNRILALPFTEPFDSISTNLTLDGYWGLSTKANSKKYSISDSPFGYYDNNTNKSFTIKWFDIKEYSNPFLEFYIKHAIEPDKDFFKIELSKNGIDWDIVDSITGFGDVFTLKKYDLSTYSDLEYLSIRFTLVSDTDITFDGVFIDDIKLYDNPTAIEIISNELPTEYQLMQNYPNPFNPSTVIEFSLPEKAITKIIIYDALGNEVAKLTDEEFEPGTYKMNYNAKNLASGIYFYKIISVNSSNEVFAKTNKMILLK